MRHNGSEPLSDCHLRLAFLVTFSILLGAGAVWMGLFVWLLEADSATLNAVADWISPERISGWAFYLLVSAICFVLFAKRFITPPRESGHIDGDHPQK